MIIKARELYNHYFNSGAERSIKAKKNIIVLSLYKGISIVLNLLLVPMTLHYVDASTYGIWLTLSSIVGWISFFDIGLNHGLKNRLAESIANNNDNLGRTYVSTTYAMLAIIFIPLMIILLLIVPFLNWISILNIDTVDNSGIVSAICIIVTYFCINFILSTINVVILAHQAPAEAAFRTLIQQAVSLLIIYILTLTTQGSLLKLCIGLCISPLIVVTTYNLTLFNGKYKNIAPSIKHVDFHKVPDLMKLGVKFFIIHIAGIVLYQLTNLLIIRYYGPTDVTAYNIAYKYFSVLYMAWNILITPVWVAVTDAAAKNDYSWIINMRKKYSRVLILFIIGGIIMFILSKFVYHIWIGDGVTISWTLSLWVLIYFVVLMFGSVPVSILNGLGKLNVQTIACCVSPIVYLVIFKLLVNINVGVYSIIIASVVANFNGYLLAPIQCARLLNKRNNCSADCS